MKLKSLLLGSAAALVAVSGARAADIVVADPEPVEYVRVCDAYGVGYFYIPGTQTCMRISGYVRADIKGGENVYARTRYGKDGIGRDTYAWRTRATLNFSTASDTELGTLRTFIQLRSQWDAGAEFGQARDSADGQIRFAYIELGGLRIGMDESIFNHWTGYFGNVLNDDIMSPFGFNRTNVISYTFSADNGFSAIIGLEQGTDGGDNSGYKSFRYDMVGGATTTLPHRLDQQIDDYMPNVLAGVKFVQGWGGVSLVAAYDAYYEEWAAKLRVDVNVTDQLSLWVMGGYKSGDDYYSYDNGYYRNAAGVRNSSYDADRNMHRVYRMASTMYGDWGGDWIVWGGGTYRFTPQTSFNFQLAYDDASTFSASANIRHELVRGLTITPELTYVSWDDDFGYKARYDAAGDPVADGVRTSLKGRDAFQGMVRVQRSF